MSNPDHWPEIILEPPRLDAIADTPLDEPDLGGPYCELCGAELERVECDQCGGDGEFDWETLQDEDPLWYQPGDTEACTQCDGKGRWWACPNAPHGKEEGDG